MDCPSVTTGNRFLAEAIAHIDCQAQAIGAYGYGALANPGSGVSIALTGLLTIFIAIFGYRLMLGEEMRARGLVGDMLKLGIVLTLATSWPAWRTLGYDVAMKAPGELAGAIAGASQLPGSGDDLLSRMQAADDAIVILTVYGTGRTMGGAVRSDTIGDRLEGIAVTDREGLADGRMAYLAGVLAPFALVRLGAGFLLALAPLMAGLLLFAGTRDLFFGWLRALAMLAVGALALAVILGVEVSILGPYLRDALAQRDGQVLTPSAPTELFVMTLAFALISYGMLAMLARIFFFGGLGVPRLLASLRPALAAPGASHSGPALFAEQREPPSRAFLVADAVAQTLRREERQSNTSRVLQQSGQLRASAGAAGAANAGPGAPSALGSSYRQSEARRYRRSSASGEKRDAKP